MREALQVGKFRGLKRCSNENGTLAVLALDHRNNLRKALNPRNPQRVTPEEMTKFKQWIVSALAKASTAVLLDPEVGAAQCIGSNTVPPETGLVVAVEATGYLGEPQSRGSRILQDWSVEKAKRMGADAVKLLVYYHPRSSKAAEIEDLVRNTAEDCKRYDILLMLEPLSYSVDPSSSKIESEEKRSVVVETAHRLTIPGVDILKAEFPADAASERDESTWAKACRELSDASRVPWVVLSAGVDFETYLRQVVVACESGASGVAAGRAVWAEAVQLKRDQKEAFLKNTAFNRMARLTAVCAGLGRSVDQFFEPPAADQHWFKTY